MHETKKKETTEKKNMKNEWKKMKNQDYKNSKMVPIVHQNYCKKKKEFPISFKICMKNNNFLDV